MDTVTPGTHASTASAPNTSAALDAHRLGAFVAEARRAAGLAQRELAERLYVSDKTVSKWERGPSQL